MGYLVFNKPNLKSGDVGQAIQLTSASYAFQVVGTGATIEFSGSNVPSADVNDEKLWIPLFTLNGGAADTEPFRQLVWSSIRYKVTAGDSVGLYVSIGAGS